MNVLVARQCQDRLVAAAGTKQTVAVPHSPLTHWMQTGRLQGRASFNVMSSESCGTLVSVLKTDTNPTLN
jgi:hypothetical protein